MSRIRWRDFRLGWYPMGSRDTMPVGSMRRARGVYPALQHNIRSRDGSYLVEALAAHSLARFAGHRYAGVGGDIYRDGISLAQSLNGNRLTFTPMPPQVGLSDNLFVAGGGELIKITSAGAVSNWGIAPPPTGFTATKAAVSSKVIDDCEAAATWSATGGSIADEATIKQVGTKSMKITVAANTQCDVTKAIATDLTTFGAAASSDADFIALWVLVDNPTNLFSIQVTFDVGAGNFATDTYTRAVLPGTGTFSPTQLVTQDIGIANIINESSVADPTNTTTPTTAVWLDALGQTSLVTTTGTWVRLRLPKATFNRTGAGAGTWANVAALKLSVIAKSGTVNVYVDDIELLGGTGLQGRYRYLVTYSNSTTGTRSNPAINADGTLPYVEVENVSRQAVSLANLPVSTDTQVNAREIWRTVGNGTLFFLIDTIADNTTTTYTDSVPDAAAFDTLAPTVMQNVELPLDNNLPEPTITFAWGPYDGAMWSCGNTADGAKGRVYFSPAGRPEAASGYIEVSTDDDPTQCGFVYNGTNYVVTTAHIYAIDGTGGIYSGPREIKGAPGTNAPHTLQVTPYGVFYQAANALQLFDGSTSSIVGQNSIADLFNGQTLEGIAPFGGIVATASVNEYYISNGTETLAVLLPDGQWRALGVGCNALCFEPDTESIQAAIASNIVLLEEPGAHTDAGTAIPFEVETTGAFVDVATQGLLQRVFIDILTNGDILTPTLIVEEWVSNGGVAELTHQEITLAPLTTTSRQIVEYTYPRTVSLVGVRLAGSLTHAVELYGVEAEIYTPVAPTLEDFYAARAVAQVKEGQ